MDARPIGFFDSGLGGLTCIPNILSMMPEERIIYFGDTARTPYGSKSIKTIKLFANQIAAFLLENDAKMIVIACNTVTATALPDLVAKYPHIPILGIVEPATEYVGANCNEENRIGVIGTKVTIESGVYPDLIKKKNPSLRIFQRACPALVPLIEEGIIENEIMDLTIKHYLDDFIRGNSLDRLILGCTHYPLIRGLLEKNYPEVKIIDPSEIIAHKVKETLERNQLFSKDFLSKGADKRQSGRENLFYASDLSENFTNMIKRIFEKSQVKVEFKNLDIDQYF